MHNNYYSIHFVLTADLPAILAPGAGRIIYQDKIIRFDKVPLVTPNGDVLIKELTFEVRLVLHNYMCNIWGFKRTFYRRANVDLPRPREPFKRDIAERGVTEGTGRAFSQ